MPNSLFSEKFDSKYAKNTFHFENKITSFIGIVEMHFPICF